jgi:hypothetical protein
MQAEQPTDLVFLVPCLDLWETMHGLLNRPEALGIRPISYRPFKHTLRDSGAFRGCQEMLRTEVRRARHALVLCDQHGCGREHLSRDELEADMERRLAQNGWEGRSAAVVIDPEAEAWFWSDSPHVAEVLGWSSGHASLRDWLMGMGYLQPGAAKPSQPDEALDKALRIAKKARSSSLFRHLAERVSLERCTDPAFLKLKSVLRAWFPPAAQ